MSTLWLRCAATVPVDVRPRLHALGAVQCDGRVWSVPRRSLSEVGDVLTAAGLRPQGCEKPKRDRRRVPLWAFWVADTVDLAVEAQTAAWWRRR